LFLEGEVDISGISSVTGVATTPFFGSFGGGLVFQLATFADTPLDLRGITDLKSVFFFDTADLVQPPIVSGLADLEVFGIQTPNSPLLNTAPVFLGSPNLRYVGISFCGLPSSETDAVIINVAAVSTSTSGEIILGSLPAAPRTSASDAAVTELEGRSPGWTVTTD
jgi:hypothetical protein